MTGHSLRLHRSMMAEPALVGNSGKLVTVHKDLGSAAVVSNRNTHVMAESALAGHSGKLVTVHKGMGSAAVVSNRNTHFRRTRDETVADSSFKRFITFYFTNFLAQLSNFYLRKGFEVCGILEEVVVPSKRNVYGEVYGFVTFSKVRDVGKLLKAVNAVWFGNF